MTFSRKILEPGTTLCLILYINKIDGDDTILLQLIDLESFAASAAARRKSLHNMSPKLTKLGRLFRDYSGGCSGGLRSCE